MTQRLVPNDFEVPTKLETEKFRLRTLTMDDVDKDYGAVISSIKHLQKTKPFGPGHDWPTEELTHKQNLIDLGGHQKEFQKRISFAYTVMSLDESECLGCVYLYPSENEAYDVQVMLWVRENKKEFDQELYQVVKEWLKRWPFKNPGFPGRDISWEEWKK